MMFSGNQSPKLSATKTRHTFSMTYKPKKNILVGNLCIVLCVLIPYSIVILEDRLHIYNNQKKAIIMPCLNDGNVTIALSDCLII